jgi:hypothetical protein
MALKRNENINGCVAISSMKMKWRRRKSAFSEMASAIESNQWLNVAKLIYYCNRKRHQYQ